MEKKEKRELPKGWKWGRLKNEITNKISLFKKDEFAEDTFKYIDISTIDNVTKRIIGYQEIPVNDAPSRAKYILEENDIIVATVRPNLNAVAIVGQPRDGNPDAAYAILDKNSVEIKRVSYDILSTQKKMRGARLPSFLIERLARGR